MSSINSTKCDACGAVTDQSSYSLPSSWVKCEIKGGGSVWGGREEWHACSKECAARMFYKLADAAGGIPNSNGAKAPSTGQPYR